MPRPGPSPVASEPKGQQVQRLKQVLEGKKELSGQQGREMKRQRAAGPSLVSALAAFKITLGL